MRYKRVDCIRYRTHMHSLVIYHHSLSSLFFIHVITPLLVCFSVSCHAPDTTCIDSHASNVAESWCVVRIREARNIFSRPQLKAKLGAVTHCRGTVLDRQAY
ncbi:hypothetical protein BDN67DRAFT_364534 [Paxillus ammoniavirescens]|nr:hypothetical protein BDN67DRAFT_364534 [Paxillus ammoniavirescens]